jgi:hypothetical protein
MLYLESNKIGEGGMIHLSKARWRDLIILNICKMQSKGIGLFWLTKLNSQDIYALDISDHQSMQDRI